MLLEAALNPSTHSFVFLASQLYNNSEVPIAFHEDCYLWLLGGANATAELTDVNDNFFVGDMDLTLAVGNSIINYAHDSDANSQMAVCGTIPNCGFYSMCGLLSTALKPAPSWLRSLPSTSNRRLAQATAQSVVAAVTIITDCVTK